MGPAATGYRAWVVNVRRVVVMIAAMALLGACSSDAAPGSAAAQRAPGDDVSDAGGVTVLGDGRVTTTPDTAKVVVGVEVERPDVGSAFDDANAAVAAVLEALRGQGVADDDLRTRELSLREQHDRPGEGTPQVTRYVATNLVEVTVDEVDRVGQLIGAAVAAGGDAARVQRLEFVVEDEGPQLQEARRLAFEDAQRRAQQYAGLAGRRLGDLRALSEVIGPDGAGAPRGAAGQASAPPVEPGRNETNVRIQATWELE